MTVTIKLKSAYEPAAEDDGLRILVDRLWPRGISKERLGAEYWAKDIAPSNELRKWYAHDPEKWDEFRERYAAELDANPDGVQVLRSHLKAPVVTFVYSSKEHHLNNAVALRDYLKTSRSKAQKKPRD